jgi:hypothetical protein
MTRTTATLCFLALCAGVSVSESPARGGVRQTDSRPAAPPRVHNRALTLASEGARQVLRLDQRQGDGVAWWPDLQMADGTIEVDIRGKDVMQQSFVGVAFHGLDETTYDAVYFRPFNFKAADPARRVRAVQYVSHPIHTWNKLREEQPGRFEQGVQPVPDPDGWFHARIVVKSPDVRVFVNGSEQASLAVTQLSNRKTGWVGVWVGNGSGGEFADLKVLPGRLAASRN